MCRAAPLAHNRRARLGVCWRFIVKQGTDPDGDPLTYTLLPGDDANAFYIEAGTGKLKVKTAVLNYEVKPL